MINELDNEPVISKKPIFLAKCINCTVIKLSSSLDIINVVSPFFSAPSIDIFCHPGNYQNLTIGRCYINYWVRKKQQLYFKFKMYR